MAAAAGGQLYTSTDAGWTWTPRAASRDWSSVASSADGTRLVVAPAFSTLYSASAPSGSGDRLEGPYGARVQLTYAGDGAWVVSGLLGTVSAF